MKKSLLIASLALLSAGSAFATVDGGKYEDVDGFTFKNKWVVDRTTNVEDWNNLPFAEMPAKVRTACLGEYNGKDAVVLGWSQTMTVDEKSNDYAHLVVMDFVTGEVLKTVQMTCDGSPITGLLCANQVGCDQFGHIWFCGYVASTYNSDTNKFTPVTIYQVTDLDAGTCVKAAELTLNEDEPVVGRIDYVHLVGDITREKAGCSVMTALASPADAPYVIAWVAGQGEDTWSPGLDDYYCAALEETYPEGQTTWGTAPMVRIVLDDDYSNNLFYVDGFTTAPSLYTNSCSLIDSFASASDLAPKVGTNGVGEFAIGGKNFMVYSMAQYDVTPGCQARIVELGEGQTFEGMKSYWEFPHNGLGEVSDGGTRIHALETKVFADENGKEGAYVLTYKCNNGIGVYAVSEQGWTDPNPDGVNDIIADQDNNAPVHYYNLNGVEVNKDNVAPGLYITRQGNTVNKVVVK